MFLTDMLNVSTGVFSLSFTHMLPQVHIQNGQDEKLLDHCGIFMPCLGVWNVSASTRTYQRISEYKGVNDRYTIYYH